MSFERPSLGLLDSHGLTLASSFIAHSLIADINRLTRNENKIHGEIQSVFLCFLDNIVLWKGPPPPGLDAHLFELGPTNTTQGEIAKNYLIACIDYLLETIRLCN